jgi:hypothetical protein
MLTPLEFYPRAVLLQGRKLALNTDEELGNGKALALIRQGVAVGSIDEKLGLVLVELWTAFETAIFDCLEEADDETPQAFLDELFHRLYAAFYEKVEASLPMAA